jgi:SAM-dependent methyltransferase
VSSRSRKPFDKYSYYLRAVQAPEIDCEFVRDTYKELNGKKARARILREDFCGTFSICCEWVKMHRDNRAIGIDLDPEPLAYGREHYLSKMKPAQQERITTVKGSVLTAHVPRADVIVALNFSYYLFKTRLLLRQYFIRARKGLRKDGLFILDCFGGMDCQKGNEERTKIDDFYYFWDQTGFNPITHEAMFHIHFKRKGENKRKKVFSYDWRMWTVPELRDTLSDAGFRRTHVYWEGTTRTGEGDGHFKRTENGDECDGWIAYIVAEP